jgi:hypothetical protein
MANSPGSATWTANIALSGLDTWLAHNGQTLYYQVTGMRDEAPVPNTGDSAIRSDPIGQSYSYVTAGAAYAGTLPSITGAQTDDAAATTSVLTEGLITGSAPITLPGAAFAGTMVAPTGAQADDNVYATGTGTTGLYVQVTGFDVPATATGIRSVTLNVIARETVATGSDPTLRLEWRTNTADTLTTGTDWTFAGTTEAPQSIDITGMRAWTVALVEGLEVRAVLRNTHDISVERVWLTVVTADPAGAQQGAAAEMAFTGVPDTALDTRVLQLRYLAVGDTFTIQVYDPSLNANTGGFTTRAGSTSACSGYTCYSYTLTANEYNAGNPRIKIIDATPTGTTQGTMTIDYARVWASA